MKIKICGMKYAANIAALAALQPDYLGFIFYPPSSRYVGDQFSAGLLRQLPPSVGRVGVFVNASVERIARLHQLYGFDLVQLHGEEPVADCEWLHRRGILCMKSFAIGPSVDFARLEAYEEWCSCFLFDTPTPAYGGSGQTFDWSVLQAYAGGTPFFLSGGLGAENMEAALALRHDRCYGLDFNSRLESSPAVKQPLLTNMIIQKIRSYGNVQS